jgi:hypothetical protein
LSLAIDNCTSQDTLGVDLFIDLLKTNS